MTLSTEMPFDLPELPNIPIAIQLPDSLLKYSLMLSKVYPKAIIVGDSTFASCCVDTVTCSHVSVELIVKFGTSCLSLIEKPVIFVFEKVIVEESVLESLVEQLNIVKANGTVVVLVACEYEHLVPLLKERVVGVSFSHIYKKQPFTPTEEYSIQGRYFDVPKDTTVTFFYIGDVESSQGTSILVQCSSFTLNNSACSIQVFDPMQGMVDWKWSIMKRFRQVELLKDAASVGIVVGTLSVATYNDTIQELTRILKESGKKVYLISVGKLNPAKLGNFADVDAFCVVGCPMTTIQNQGDYWKCMATPWEVKMSIQGWGGYELELKKLHLETVLVESSDEPRFSLATGQLVSNNEIVYEDGKELIQRMDGTISKITELRFSQKTFQGLEIDKEVPVQKVEQGRGGIARGYTNERS